MLHGVLAIFSVVLYAFYFNARMKAYVLTPVIVVFIILVVFVVMARRCETRVRENEVYIILIVDHHYLKYIEQEEKAQY